MHTIYITDWQSVPAFAQFPINEIISIGDMNGFPNFRNFANRDFTLHKFRFDDISHACPEGPQEKDIARMIKIFKDMPQDSHILFHCAAGISRSTASAFIFLVQCGMSYIDAYRTLLNVRGPFIRPNQEMVKIADNLMGKNGEMYKFMNQVYGKGII